MPSYLVVGRSIANSSIEWINYTWTNDTEFRLANLTAYITYNVTVYVRENQGDKSLELCNRIPLRYIYECTGAVQLHGRS